MNTSSLGDFGKLEQIGMVALIGLLVFPGVIWVSKAKTGGSMVLRAAIAGSLLVGAVILEASMDETAESVAQAV